MSSSGPAVPALGGDGSVDGNDDADVLPVSVAGRLAVRIVTSDIEDAGSLRFLGFKILDVVDACGDGGECVEGDAGDCCCKVSKDDDLDAGVPVGVAPRVLPADGCMRFRVFDVIGPDVGGELSPSEMTGDLRIVVALLALVPDKALGDVVSKCD